MGPAGRQARFVCSSLYYHIRRTPATALLFYLYDGDVLSRHAAFAQNDIPDLRHLRCCQCVAGGHHRQICPAGLQKAEAVREAFGLDHRFDLIFRTHLCGGSAGREGVAVQLGATVAYWTGNHIPQFQKQKSLIRILTISGMSAGFSGLFHAPLAAVCFALEVLVVGKLEYRALLPAALSAITANIVSIALGLETFQVTLPETVVSPISIPMLILGVAAGLTGGVFTFLLKQAKQAAAKWLPNPMLRIVICGAGLAILLYLCGKGRYSGLGTNLIALSCNGDTVYWFDFLGKLGFTVLTLAIGFQGGEVTPLFAIGACLGAVLAPLLGIPSVVAAALCYAAVFGSASNTLLAPICIGAEVFGFSYFPYFAVVCTIARLCNGNHSMYGKQTTTPLFFWREDCK